MPRQFADAGGAARLLATNVFVPPRVANRIQECGAPVAHQHHRDVLAATDWRKASCRRVRAMNVLFDAIPGPGFDATGLLWAAQRAGGTDCNPKPTPVALFRAIVCC